MLSFSLIVDPVRDALNSQVRHFSRLDGWAIVVVAIGVALEGIEIIHDVIAWSRRKYREKRERAELEEVSQVFPCGETRGETESHSDHPRWVKRWLRVGLLMVVVGVVAEWRCGTKLEDAHDAVHQYDLGKILEADQKAGDAAQSAKIAHDEADAVKGIADAAKREAGEAQQESGWAKEMSSKTAAAIADRSLTDKQVASIGSKLEPFAGQEYDVVAYWDSKESVGIANRVHQALQTAHWTFLPLKEWHGLMGGLIGIQAWIHPDADERTKKAAAALVGALIAEGLEASLKVQNPTNNPKHNKISLSVGSKR